MTDEDVASNLADFVQEAEVGGVILNPRDLQVTIDVGTVRVPVSKVPVVVHLVGWH